MSKEELKKKYSPEYDNVDHLRETIKRLSRKSFDKDNPLTEEEKVLLRELEEFRREFYQYDLSAFYDYFDLVMLRD